MQRALRLVPTVVGLGLLLVGLASALAPPRPLGQPSPVLTLGAAALLIATGLRAGRLPGVRREPPGAPGRAAWAAVALLGVLTVLACTAVTVRTAYHYGWDPVTVQQVAEGTREPASARRYFSVYPNILPMLMIGKLAVRVEDTTGLDYTSFFIGVAVVSLALVLIAGATWLIRRGAGPIRVAAFIVLTGLVVGLSPWVGVPYTDLVGLPVGIVVVALLSGLPDRRGARGLSLVAGVAVLVGIGWGVKTTPVVLLATVVLGVLLAPAPAPWSGPRRWLTASAVVGLALVTSMGLVSIARPLSDLPLREDIEVDTSLYVAAGLRIQEYADGQPCYGCFDRTLTRPTYGKDRAAQRGVALPSIRESLDGRSIAEHLTFYAHKTQQTWGDGMFFAWGEGLDRTEPLQRPLPHDSVIRALGTSQGQLLGTRSAVIGGLWAGVLVLAAVRLWQRRQEWDVIAVAAALAGLFTFTTLFQGRGRYVLVMAPVLIALACLPRPRREVTSPGSGIMQR